MSIFSFALNRTERKILQRDPVELEWLIARIREA